MEELTPTDYSNCSRKHYYFLLHKAGTCIYLFFWFIPFISGLCFSNNGCNIEWWYFVSKDKHTWTEPYKWAHLSCCVPCLSSHCQHSSRLHFWGFVKWPSLVWYVQCVGCTGLSPAHPLFSSAFFTSLQWTGQWKHWPDCLRKLHWCSLCLGSWFVLLSFALNVK